MALIRNIIERDGDTFIVFQVFLRHESFYTYPLNSVSLGVFSVSRIDGQMRIAPLSDITKKYVLLPKANSLLVVPLLHCV